MNIIFIGVQGSGKGTQAKIISQKTGFCHISTGDLLRGAKGELKEKVDFVMNSGALLPDDLMLQILKERMKKDDCQKGIILDGFPRNLEQAKLLESEIKIDKIIEIKISDSEALKRLEGRVSCNNCGAGYNLYTAPKPKDPKICDNCGGELFQRKDDNPDAIKKRIETYHQETEPVLENYKDRLITINGERDIEEISNDIILKLN
jgi:adenylate kinase